MGQQMMAERDGLCLLQVGVARQVRITRSGRGVDQGGLQTPRMASTTSSIAALVHSRRSVAT